VRAISAEVQGQSRDIREKLREELTPAEQKEIRETLPDARVGEVFTK